MRHSAIAAVAGLLITAPLFAGGLFDDDDCRHSAARRASTPAAGINRVVIHAESGSLEVTGTAGATEIAVSGTACTSDEDFLPRMTLTLRKSGNDLHIVTNIPEKNLVFGFFTARLDFDVTLPAGMPVVIDDDSGSIRLSNTGTTVIEDDSGSIEVRNVRGDLTIDDDSGPADIDGVSGNVKIEDESGELIVRNIGGSVAIEDDSGSITVAGVEGSLHIHNDDSGSIEVRSVRGNVRIDEDGSGLVDVADVGGSFTIGRKSGGSIDHVRVAGKVSIPRDDD